MISPSTKVFSGVLLLMPSVFIFFAAILFRFDNPTLTETQLFNEIGWMPLLALLLAVPGGILLSSGWTEYEDTDE